MDSGVQPLDPQQTAKQEKKTDHNGYVHRVLVGVDQATNVITGGLSDETISSRAARDAEQGRLAGKVLSHVLDLFQKDHGAKATASDAERAKEVEQTENSSGLIS